VTRNIAPTCDGDVEQRRHLSRPLGLAVERQVTARAGRANSGLHPIPFHLGVAEISGRPESLGRMADTAGGQAVSRRQT